MAVRSNFERFADYKSAIRQITNLRYEAALCVEQIPLVKARQTPDKCSFKNERDSWDFNL
jgi:hypothetical protein